ncbi:hypothetical protein EGT74_18245 [Chitinophaga lutea]|uniref:Outer membrane protein beta-barrel domain-containing protein n=1 Tax=Chitinophaga lutea TaxID=2488634 RepID=A0A3N4PY09_9BACT|nr:hypothetical protein [Chitinophaga lutea]RPE08957.1 hypothetical protein EGT74_18245 [Chitinophaga lutea]
MKHFYLILLLLVPLVLQAQRRENFSNAYLGVMMHNSQAGISLVNSFGFIRYAGIGAGVDLTSFCNNIMVPVYFDVRLKYPVGRFIPYALGQFGKPLYEKNNALTFREETGAINPIKINGRHFFGSGVGFQYRADKVWLFASYIRREYHMQYEGKRTLPHSFDTQFNANTNIFMVGFTF